MIKVPTTSRQIEKQNGLHSIGCSPFLFLSMSAPLPRARYNVTASRLSRQKEGPWIIDPHSCQSRTPIVKEDVLLPPLGNGSLEPPTDHFKRFASMLRLTFGPTLQYQIGARADCLDASNSAPIFETNRLLSRIDQQSVCSSWLLLAD